MRMTLSAATTAALALCLSSSPALAALDDGILGKLLNAGKPDTQTTPGDAPTESPAVADKAVSDKPAADTGGSGANNLPPQVGGHFSEPFAEPTLVVDGKTVETDERCLAREDGTLSCKPAKRETWNCVD